MKVVITKHYGGVLFACGVLAWQQYYHAFGIVVPLRRMIFNEEFMAKFKETHKITFTTTPSPLGYPDSGAGRYSKSLPYENWYKFNIAQRVHGNSIEHLNHMIPILLLSGLFYPKIVAL